MSAWQGRVDRIDGPAGRRWHQVVHPIEQSTTPGVALLGFACDTGIRRNHGRPGAVDGPHTLRRYLSNLAWHGGDLGALYDAGDVRVTGDALEEAQSDYARRAARALRHGHRVVGLGGGHEIAWASYQGLASALAGDARLQRVGVVNFDAHFDLRRPEHAGLGSSGTPFLQIAEARAAAGLPFDYLCLGISETANTPALFERAASLGVRYVSDVDIGGAQAETTLREFIARCDAIYCTFCLDVLPPAVAPGVSAPSGLGVSLHRAITLLRTLVVECRRDPAVDKLAIADVAEFSPAHDAPDGRTGRAAARIVYELAAVGR
ncbi:MAG TPA: formimidoylglutamase [Steroidobacteraceae bacterium]|nr:formimidoylglutamase [Steroidobacteraceae bacterium]